MIVHTILPPPPHLKSRGMHPPPPPIPPAIYAPGCATRQGMFWGFFANINISTT